MPKLKAKSFGNFPRDFYQEQQSELTDDFSNVKGAVKPTNRRVNSYVGIYNIQTNKLKTPFNRFKISRPITANKEIPMTEKAYKHYPRITTASTKTCTNTIQPSSANSHRLIEKKVDKSDKKLQKIKKLEELLQACKSDKLEIKRDLATYDYNLCEKIDFMTKITRINNQLLGIPMLIANNLEVDKSFNFVSSLFLDSIKQIEDLSYESSSTNPKLIRIEKFEVKPKDTMRKLKYQLSTLTKISGIYGILTLNSDDLHCNFYITFETTSGIFLKLNLNRNLNKQDSRLFGKTKFKRLKELILPNLFITFYKQKYQLS